MYYILPSKLLVGKAPMPNLCMCAQSLKSCPTLCDPMDCSPLCSSVHGILQARILEWIAMPSSGDLPNLGIESTSLRSPALAGTFFTTSTTWKVQQLLKFPNVHYVGKERKTKCNMFQNKGKSMWSCVFQNSDFSRFNYKLSMI